MQEQIHDGIAEGCTIAVGSHGTLKQSIDRQLFSDGLSVVVKRVKPHAIVVYGCAPEDIFGKYRDQGIAIVQFDSAFACAHKDVA